MLKITLKPVSGFNVAYNGEPVKLHDLKMDADMFSRIDKVLHSIRESSCDSKVASLEYVDHVVTFLRHSNGQDSPMYIPKFPIELLTYLKQIEAAILPLYSE